MERKYIQYKSGATHFDLIDSVSDTNKIIELMFACINSNVTQTATLENKNLFYL